MLDWILSLPWWGWVIIIGIAWFAVSYPISLIAARMLRSEERR